MSLSRIRSRELAPPTALQQVRQQDTWKLLKTVRKKKKTGPELKIPAIRAANAEEVNSSPTPSDKNTACLMADDPSLNRDMKTFITV